VKDPYRHIAGIYDRLFDSMNKGLRLVGIRLFRPSKGMSILDVGCGTGSHLELYQRYQCHLYGLDLSPSMLAVARERLGDAVQLDLGDATAMPYEDDQFDLVMCMLSLHEMSPQTRSGVLDEIRRVLKTSGRILLIDYHPGPYQPLQGWTSKTVIFLSELAAGPQHFRHYRHFMRNGGLSALVTQHSLKVEKQRVLAGGTFAVCLANHPAHELAVRQDGQGLKKEVLSNGRHHLSRRWDGPTRPNGV
jgi:ubiquinone/menaquinone biosynthesis C-methylase UbiE